ncbi:aminomethyl-transferring glycine dehydrogenase [Nocardioides sp. LMS-CY]|uniref:aminomethyl-transferring glycine dehydrogenase n=1 Tax=Nocardioides sp. (strain LMS-CY) TaxID=2840457 RepID=UPI001C001834|nr:aminomethyl-transferring glycine dehydrogenase [Nocardioides sp. LMS-CY]QWF22308.1 aminomethyl-transferring glycine dehydrogenase [Nocardioides sp. LMS-CY]
MPDQSPPSDSRDIFARRHIGPSADDVACMLKEVGYGSLEDLIDVAVPEGIRTAGLRLPPAATEPEAADELRALSAANNVTVPMIGLGYYPTSTPSVIRRNVLESPAWYTAYTPYQPEISQGRLEALLNFQTMVGDLTGLPTSNASLLDEGTAVAEAIMVMRRAVASSSNRVLVDADLFPQSIAVAQTRAAALGIEVALFDADSALPDVDYFGVVVSYPGCSGEVRNFSSAIRQAHRSGALVTIAADLLALTLLSPPGDLGADIAVGSTQRFGVPLFYGGPHAGYIAIRDGLERHLPGRLVGVSIDAHAQPAYRLALQTREQHIRRDRATSNICTAQVLLAVVASLYAVYHGPEGLTAIAERIHRYALRVAAALRRRGYSVINEAFFDTIVVYTPGRAAEIVANAHTDGILLRLVDDEHVGISCSETTTPEHLKRILASFGEDAVELTEVTPDLRSTIPPALRRTSTFLTHPVFSQHRSETTMLRYLRELADRDFALDRGMIPLGSCTMKLNASTEMEPVSLSGFADLHPFAPAEDALGYAELVRQLESWLAEITGYAAVSIQPNAGSQGELAGLLAIRAYHRDQEQPDRDVCLIPASAHGTNAASAVLAGMRVVVVASNDDGTIDMGDLEAKCETHSDRLAAVMVTYPSTHGVYEEGITRLCELVHHHGGQVYVDGANLNALLGVAKPGEFGGDVSHLNLHKTFCIPHGGGGPGVGPVAVAAHLVPYLPTHPSHPDPHRRHGVGAVSAAPYGSAGILPIPWAYIRMMGSEGLTRATMVAVLAANYVATRLSGCFPVLYTGAKRLVAHECILDLRPLTASTGVTVEDVAKRLADYGFHAPTVSFPVAGTLMIEPTESEGLREIDRFIDAMTAIRREIDDIAAGRWRVEDSPLRHSPHTAAALAGDWSRPYSRAEGAYPTGITRSKYWPSVGRVDQAHGDRHLVCSCPDPTAFEN